MAYADNFEVIGVKPVWCRFDGKCWSESEYDSYAAFCSDHINKVSEFSVDCAVVVRHSFTSDDSDNHFDIKIPLVVYVKFHDFIRDYEIEACNGSLLKCSFCGGDIWYYKNETFSLDVSEKKKLVKNVCSDIVGLGIRTYINDGVEYHLGHKDDGKLADEIIDKIANVVADGLEKFNK